MNRAVRYISDSIVSPLGKGTAKNYGALQNGESGIRYAERKNQPFYASYFREDWSHPSYTKFESICIEAVNLAIAGLHLSKEKTILVLSSTKGNIELLGSENIQGRIALHTTANFIAQEAGFTHSLVVSNACISGVLALQVAKQFIQAGAYDHAVVLGADVLSDFVISGFQSLGAISDIPCRPFDTDRKGISLGEAAAVIVLSANPEDVNAEKSTVELCAVNITNDANHISGPSRTGEELAHAIDQTFQQCCLKAGDIDFVSAHGTATLYNDEMEARAFSLLGLNDVPLHSAKGHYGHTLGAAGILETIIAKQSLMHNEIIPTKGFESLGVTQKLNVVKDIVHKPLRTILKTASGFGGCNAALIMQKTD